MSADSGKPTPPKRPKADWDAIEPHYRANILSLKEIGATFGVSDAAIIKHARKAGWVRDLGAKIAAKAEAKVSEASVSAEVRANRQASERAVIEATSDLIANARLAHRKEITRTKNILAVLLGELEVTSNPEGQGLIEALADVVGKPDRDETEEETKKRRKRQEELLESVLALPERVDVLKKLAEAQDRLIQLERQAYGITDKTPLDGGQGDALKLLSDAERASRLAAFFELARQRRNAAASTPIPPGPSAPPAANESPAADAA